MKEVMFRIASFICIVLLLEGIMPDLTQAAMVRVENLQGLVEQSHRIFSGKCIAEESGKTNNIPYSAYTFRVIDPIKGITTRTIVVKQFGVSHPIPIGNGMALAPSMSGMPTYKVDQEYMLFLVKESSLGLSSPVGLFQGAFQIRGSYVVNDIDNQNIASRLSASWLQAKGLVVSEINMLKDFKKGPLDYQFFNHCVKTILEN